MKNLFLLLVLCFFFSSSLIAGEDVRKFDITGFSGVDVGWGMHVKITQSDNYSIEVKAAEKHFKYLKVEKEGNTLKIYIDKRNYRLDDEVYINILMPKLNDIALHGGADGTIKMDVSENFSVTLSGGAQLKGELKCSDIDISLSGGSQVTLNGNAGDLSADGSGGSVFRLKDLSVKNVDAELSGGSMVYIKMNGKINIDASGGSQVKYYGTATLGHLDFSGGSGIAEGN